jgi:hypothetical protein
METVPVDAVVRGGERFEDLPHWGAPRVAAAAPGAARALDAGAREHGREDPVVLSLTVGFRPAAGLARVLAEESGRATVAGALHRRGRPLPQVPRGTLVRAAALGERQRQRGGGRLAAPDPTPHTCGAGMAPVALSCPGQTPAPGQRLDRRAKFNCPHLDFRATDPHPRRGLGSGPCA